MARNLLRHLHISTEFAFLLSGSSSCSSWALNLMGHLGESDSGHGASDVYLWLFLMFQDLPSHGRGRRPETTASSCDNTRLARRYLLPFCSSRTAAFHLLGVQIQH